MLLKRYPDNVFVGIFTVDDVDFGSRQLLSLPITPLLSARDPAISGAGGGLLRLYRYLAPRMSNMHDYVPLPHRWCFGKRRVFPSPSGSAPPSFSSLLPPFSFSHHPSPDTPVSLRLLNSFPEQQLLTLSASSLHLHHPSWLLPLRSSRSLTSYVPLVHALRVPMPNQCPHTVPGRLWPPRDRALRG